MTDTMEQRVAKGVALLDKMKPEWRTLVDLDALEMHSVDQCILAQIYGGYIDGTDALGIVGPQHGFDLTVEEYAGESGTWGPFGDLHTLWARAVTTTD